MKRGVGFAATSYAMHLFSFKLYFTTGFCLQGFMLRLKALCFCKKNKFSSVKIIANDCKLTNNKISNFRAKTMFKI